MIATKYNPAQLQSILSRLADTGVITGFSTRDNSYDLPQGESITEQQIDDALTEQLNNEQVKAATEQAKATKKSAIFLDLKTRLAADLNITVASPADLAGRIEEVIPAARAKRNGKASIAERLAEVEKQVELLSMFVALLSRH